LGNNSNYNSGYQDGKEKGRGEDRREVEREMERKRKRKEQKREQEIKKRRKNGRRRRAEEAASRNAAAVKYATAANYGPAGGLGYGTFNTVLLEDGKERPGKDLGEGKGKVRGAWQGRVELIVSVWFGILKWLTLVCCREFLV